VGLSRRLVRPAVARVVVLVAEVPGWGRTRCAVEQELRRRGWRPALSPADADALVVCGEPGTRLQASFELIWEQLPGPRARAVVLIPSAVRAALDQVHADLADDAHQRRDAAERSTGPAMGISATGGNGRDAGGDADEAQDAAAEADGTPQGSQEGSEHHHGDMDMGDDMDMPMPAGIPLAGGGEDRDGLNLDVLHVPLGPVLPAWPAGLLLHCVTQGDVVVGAHAEVLGPSSAPSESGSLVLGSPAERCDRAARLLTVAGWEGAAVATTRLRDELLGAAPPASCLPAVDRLITRVRRARVLRWSLRGRVRRDGNRPGPTDPGSPPAEDTYGRLLGMLTTARSGLGGSAAPIAPTALNDLPALVAGQDLASIRLLVAALELDTAALVHVGVSGA